MDYVTEYICGELKGNTLHLAIYNYLVQRTHNNTKTGNVWSISHSSLAKLFNSTRKTIGKHMHQLEEWGLIERITDKNITGVSPSYRIYNIIPIELEKELLQVQQGNKKPSNAVRSDGQHELCTEVF